MGKLEKTKGSIPLERYWGKTTATLTLFKVPDRETLTPDEWKAWCEHEDLKYFDLYPLYNKPGKHCPTGRGAWSIRHATYLRDAVYIGYADDFESGMILVYPEDLKEGRITAGKDES